MKPEQKFYQRFARALPKCDITRVENIMESGMPDVNVCYMGMEVWVELKVFVEGRVLIRPAQNAWGHRRSFHGGRVLIIAEYPCGDVFVGQFPEINVIAYQKYLSVTNLVPFTDVRDIFKYVFPDVNK